MTQEFDEQPEPHDDGSSEGRSELRPPPPLPESAGAGPTKSVLSDEDKLYVLGAHLAWFIAPVLGPLVVWLIMKDKGPQKAFVVKNAIEALNFQITSYGITLILTLVGSVICFPLILVPVVAIGSMVLAIMATVAAADGKPYSYPFTLRLIS